MNLIENLFGHRTVNREKLLTYGFCGEAGRYVYETALRDSGFVMTVTVM